MRKKNPLVLFSLFFFGFFLGFGLPPSSAAEPASLTGLMDELNSNQVRFDKNYKGQALTVIGHVGDIEDRGDFYALKLFAAPDARSEKSEKERYVLCVIDKSQENAVLELNRGDVISLTGKYQGRQEKLDGFFVLSDVRLPASGPAASSLYSADIIAVVPTADNVNLRGEPGPQGKILGRAGVGYPLLVEPRPVREVNSKTEWYRVLYFVSPYDRTLVDPTKLKEYENRNPWISVSYVRPENVSEELLKELEWFRAGKPLAVKIGDDFSAYFKEHQDEADRVFFESSFDLYAEPRPEAELAPLLPPGEKILVANDLIYTDVENTDWFAIVDDDTKILLGWAEIERYQKTPKKYLEP